MTPTTLAETILRDVPTYDLWYEGGKLPFAGATWMTQADVLAALSTALDGVDERAGEVLDSLAVLADMADLFSAPLLDDDDKPEMTVALERIVAAVPALLAQNAALRAERDELSSKLEVERALTDAVHRLAKAAEAQIAALTARVEGLTGAGKDAADDWEECVGHVVAALGHKPDWYDHEIASIADFRAALTTEAAHVNEAPKSKHDAGNVLTAAQAREAALHPDDMLPEAIRLIRQEATRDHSQEIVTGLKHIALLLEQLSGEARDD